MPGSIEGTVLDWTKRLTGGSPTEIEERLAPAGPVIQGCFLAQMWRDHTIASDLSTYQQTDFQ